MKTPNFLIFWLVLPNHSYIFNAKILPKKSIFWNALVKVLILVVIVIFNHIILFVSIAIHIRAFQKMLFLGRILALNM